ARDVNQRILPGPIARRRRARGRRLVLPTNPIAKREERGRRERARYREGALPRKTPERHRIPLERRKAENFDAELAFLGEPRPEPLGECERALAREPSRRLL